MITFPEILLIGNSLDFSTDYIAICLEEIKASYIRINFDEFYLYDFQLDPIEPSLCIFSASLNINASLRNLKSIYFRGPTFLRETNSLDSLENQLCKNQWAAFLRSLSCFENCTWINWPQNTYLAEIKPFQLLKAKKTGFNVPRTLISNNFKANEVSFEHLVTKSIDTYTYRTDSKIGFAYTNLMRKMDPKDNEKLSFPIIFQEAIEPKIDLRVTVIGKSVFCTEITTQNEEMQIDWRLNAKSAKYKDAKIQSDLKLMCIKYVKDLGLIFGAIDFVKNNNEYYFIEINPTGEWAWIQNQLGYRIDLEICNILSGEK